MDNIIIKIMFSDKENVFTIIKNNSQRRVLNSKIVTVVIDYTI